MEAAVEGHEEASSVADVWAGLASSGVPCWNASAAVGAGVACRAGSIFVACPLGLHLPLLHVARRW